MNLRSTSGFGRQSGQEELTPFLVLSIGNRIVQYTFFGWLLGLEWSWLAGDGSDLNWCWWLILVLAGHLPSSVLVGVGVTLLLFSLQSLAKRPNYVLPKFISCLVSFSLAFSFAIAVLQLL